MPHSSCTKNITTNCTEIISSFSDRVLCKARFFIHPGTFTEVVILEFVSTTSLMCSRSAFKVQYLRISTRSGTSISDRRLPEDKTQRKVTSKPSNDDSLTHFKFNNCLILPLANFATQLLHPFWFVLSSIQVGKFVINDVQCYV